MQKIQHSNLSLGNQAYQEVKKIILEGQVIPGQKLNEGDLAKALGISRTPVREAINRLEKEGLVEIFPQRGAYVVQFSREDILELFLIREKLEGLAAYLAAEKADEATLEKLEYCLRGFEEPFDDRDIQRYAREDFKFHQTLVNLSGGRWLKKLVGTLHDHIRIFRLTAVGSSARMKISLQEHHDIIAALRRRDPKGAEERMRRHIQHVRDGVMSNIHFFMKEKSRPSPEARRN
jgi:DNA-binding GntR family transcriptional regulator